jgi:hypothetical protein
MDTAGVIRTFLVVDAICMALLGLVYLRQRRLGWRAFCGWSLLAILVPVLGPFLVIASRPGSWNRDFSFGSDFHRAGQLLGGLIRSAGDVNMSSRIERARQRLQTRRSSDRER